MSVRPKRIWRKMTKNEETITYVCIGRFTSKAALRKYISCAGLGTQIEKRGAGSEIFFAEADLN